MKKEMQIDRLDRQEVPRKATTFTLIPDAQSFFSELKDRTDNATTSIRLQSFLLSNDPVVGGPILSSLEQSARRGRNVWVMADGMFPEKLIALSQKKPFSRLFRRLVPTEAQQTVEAITHL